MKVSELIEALKAFPPDMDVAYINDCADYGQSTYTIGAARVEAGAADPWSGLPSFPTGGIVVLS